MCLDPITLGLATAAIGAASTATQFIGARQQARSQRDAAAQNFVLERNALAQQGIETEQARSGEIFNAAIERVQQGGAIAVGAAEGGLSQITSGRLIQGANAVTGRNQTTAEQQLDLQVGQQQRQFRSANLRRNSTVASNRGPSVLSLVTGLAGSALGGFNATQGARAASAAGP